MDIDSSAAQPRKRSGIVLSDWLRCIAVAILILIPSLAVAQADNSLPNAPEPAVAVADNGSAVQPDLNLERASVGEQATELRHHFDDTWIGGGANLSNGHGRLLRFDPGANQDVRIDVAKLFRTMDRPATNSSSGAVINAQLTYDQMPEGYHWKGLLWESFAFFGVQNTYRLMTDPYLRYLIADKPFWHDYFSSVAEWDFDRWSDGDDFLVAYIAHPLQGSVTEFIEIQNSPRQRDLRFGDGKVYWRSRLLAFVWATIYSFDQKFGPLGETALGSEGGYNYVAGCAAPCPTYAPGRYVVTNNTGDVKLFSTPVVGTLWTVVEDGIDRYLDRVQDNDPHAKVLKVLRGGLNPARSTANLLRWRKPWYRDYQQDGQDLKLTRPVHWLPGNDAAIQNSPQFEIFPHFNAIWLPVNTASCSPCRQLVTGPGVGFAWRAATYVDLDFDVNYMGNASPLPSDRAGGDIISGTFGLRSGYTGRWFSLKGSLRPGFLSYSDAYEASPSSTIPTPSIGRITHFTVALVANADIFLNRNMSLRISGGNQPVRYREPYLGPFHGTYPYIFWISDKNFLTNNNWTYQTGVVFRF